MKRLLVALALTVLSISLSGCAVEQANLDDEIASRPLIAPEDDPNFENAGMLNKIPGVIVVIEYPGDEAQRAGLTRSVLQSAVELRLQTCSVHLEMSLPPL